MRLLSLMATVLVTTFLGPAVQPAPPSRGPFERELRSILARPPHHVRRAATISPTGYVPAQIRHAYGFDLLPQNMDGTSQVVAVVDAYDDPTAEADLQTFISTFNLPGMNGLPGTPNCTVASGPHPCFQKITPQGSPPANGDWALEISLDVQWAHAIAPGADILLVEAYEPFLFYLLDAINAAVNNGAGVVSMSWGTDEFFFESLLDYFYLNYNGVTLVAASGDNGTPFWPAASPSVVAVGGSTLPLDSSGNLTAPETVWNNSYGSSGGGISPYEFEPAFQFNYPIPDTGGYRGIPDVSYDADPNTGVSVYDSTPIKGESGWFTVGGTSIGAPQWAAVLALADQARSQAGTSVFSSSDAAHSPLYYAGSPSQTTPCVSPPTTTYCTNYSDITSGTNGAGFPATPGYDFATGLGSPSANNLVPYVVTYPF
jgi:subtilase family serine protease